MPAREKPRLEKVDAYTIRVIVEKEEIVPITQLLKNKKALTEQKERAEKVLGNIEEILAQAKKMGITAEPSKPIKPKPSSPPRFPGSDTVIKDENKQSPKKE